MIAEYGPPDLGRNLIILKIKEIHKMSLVNIIHYIVWQYSKKNDQSNQKSLAQ